MRHGLLWLGCVLAATSVLTLLLGPLGTRAGWWTFVTGFTLLRWSAYLGLAAAAVSLVGGAVARRWRAAAVAIAVGLAVAAVPWNLLRAARGAPPIHDITTDLQDPPRFVAVLPLRTGSPNPPEYLAGAVADAQRRAYPDIQPLVLPIPAAQAFERALAAARDLGWEIVASDRAAGRIEAMDTTYWFGFTDDVVIRIQDQAGGGARIDVRSKSRVGRGDVGANARRIRNFLRAVQQAT
jgi:uncharacterized protein (DUF1499 family)